MILILKKLENDGAEEIGLVTQTQYYSGRSCETNMHRQSNGK